MRYAKLGIISSVVVIPAAVWGQVLFGGQPQATVVSPNGQQQMAPPSAPSGASKTYVVDPPADIREEELANMLHTMKGIEAILAGLAEGDFARVSQAASDNGMAYIASRNNMCMWSMSHGYPWMNFRHPTHAQFDRIADLAKQGSDIQTLVKETSVLIQKCNACHDAFKFQYNCK
jgi:hypothetical protein